MPNIITNPGPVLLTKLGQSRNAPADINDYLGRLVNFYHNTYTVTRVEASQQAIRLLNGDPFLGDARLYLAREDGDDGRPVGRWTEASTIAAPGKTILHWNHRTDYRADPAACADLYRRAVEAEAQRTEEHRRAEEERRAEEARCEALWKEFTPAWAKGYLVAELRRNDSDIMTDYFSYSITEKVLLGFSKSDRNSFAEMRKAAATFPPTAHLALKKPIADRDVSVPRSASADGTALPSSESECRTGRATERYGVEHRENYTGGSGYYLGGPSSYSGWTIRKRSLKYGLPQKSNAVISFTHWILNH